MTIVIIDDCALTTAILKGLAGGRGARAVTTFTSPLKALEFLEVTAATAIVVDCSMPELDGIEVIRRVRSGVVNSAVPIIMVTGAENEEALRLATEAGVTHFLRKPVKTHEFKAVLAQTLPDGGWPLISRRESDTALPEGMVDRRRPQALEA